METQLSLVEKLEKLLDNKQIKEKTRNSHLTILMEKVSKKGLLEKSEYSLPLKDTIGRTLHDLTKFNDK
ncbi:hypothetical protein QQ020_19460 [Fulvivirgaceae bacterium BMA12]|uniref:Uncharacterized protein n=1 Tax=Agaribacillus aureus TaxID=3051825 RepID=A0ABT8LBX9_9BACT|nr:hypothetical protein [Fulvivirgaceae bacterium BMA12]